MSICQDDSTAVLPFRLLFLLDGRPDPSTLPTDRSSSRPYEPYSVDTAFAPVFWPNTLRTGSCWPMLRTHLYWPTLHTHLCWPTLRTDSGLDHTFVPSDFHSSSLPLALLRLFCNCSYSFLLWLSSSVFLYSVLVLSCSALAMGYETLFFAFVPSSKKVVVWLRAAETADF